MKTTTSVVALAAACLLLSSSLFSQTRAFNQNSSRSNHTRGMSIFFSPVYTTPVAKGEDSLLFRGSGAGLKFGGDYFFGNLGLGAVSGFSSSQADDALINDFLQRNSIPQDQLVISKSAQQSMYLLLGPSIRFGKEVQLMAHAKGGLFINNGGLVNIQQKGAQRSVYRNEATTKSIYPGFQTGLAIQYSTKNDTWSFGFGADYMSTRTQVQNYDLRRAGGVEGLKLSRTISDLMAGISIRYSIKSPRDAASGQATGKRSAAPRDAASGQATGRRTYTPRDAASGLPTGKRTQEVIEEITIDESGVHRMVSTNDGQITIDESGVHRMAAPNCGPVTQRVTNPDGSTSEMTFACPDDAAAYSQRLNGGMPNRISMNVTTPKQTQGATFGEKVNQGLQAASSALSQGNNIISGNISWATEKSTGIVTNKTVSTLSRGGSGAAAASYAATGRTISNPTPGIGSVLTLYSREAGSGQASGKREKGSGLATGRRQYQPLYREGSGNSCDTCSVTVRLSSVQNNPYYAGNELAGENVEMINSQNNPMYNGNENAGVKNNPLYKDKGNSGNNPLHGRTMPGEQGQTGDGLSGVEVYLKDPGTGAVIASTITDAAGSYFFANVPDGDYEVAITGTYAYKKSYDMYNAIGMDISGKVQVAGTGIQVNIDQQATTTPVDGPTVVALLKSKTKSNQSNDRTAAPATEDGIWSPRSNVKTLPVTVGDVDGDGAPDLVSGNVATAQAGGLVGGVLPGGQVISAIARPGNPIGGISIKGGKNPGGNIGARTTNENGEFEFTDLEAGNYTFTVEQTLHINDKLLISVGNTKARDYNSSRSNKTGSVIDPGAGGGGSGGGNKVQDHNSSRSNKSSSVAAPDTDGGAAGGGKAQDYNSSRSNKTASGISTDPGAGERLVASKGDVKLTASQNSQSLRTISVVADLDGDGVYETDVTSKVSDELLIDRDGNVTEPQQKAGVSTSRSNIRTKSSLQAVTTTIYTGYGTAIINGKEVPVKTVYKVVEKATSGLKDTLKTQV